MRVLAGTNQPVFPKPLLPKLNRCELNPSGLTGPDELCVARTSREPPMRSTTKRASCCLRIREIYFLYLQDIFGHKYDSINPACFIFVTGSCEENNAEKARYSLEPTSSSDSVDLRFQPWAPLSESVARLATLTRATLGTCASYLLLLTT